MKIGFDAKRLFNNYTGLGNYSRTLVKNIAQNYPKNEYHLYSTHSNKNNETELFYDKNNFSLHFNKSFFKSIWRSFGIVKQLKKDKIDIYHGLSNELPFGIKNSGIKTIVTIHDLIFKIYPETYPFVDRLIYDFKFKYACKTADKIIAISEQTKKDIIRFYNIAEDKIEVVYQSCQEQFFRECDLDKSILNQYSFPESYNLYVGSVNERKNLKSIVKAYSILKKDELTPLVIVGNGKKYKQECVELIAKLKLEEYFIWVDNLTDVKHLQLAYMNAKIFIYPSLYEGFGIPIIEALLSKIPVITSNTSCLPEATGGFAKHINPENPHELANAISNISDLPSDDEQIINGYEFAKHTFSNVNICKVLNDSIYH